MNYMNRPLLPLKSIHKQKSLSCSNLVQTFKRFSKRNLSDNSKPLLVEKTEKSAEEKKENCISEASISKDDKAKDFLAGKITNRRVYIFLCLTSCQIKLYYDLKKFYYTKAVKR